MAWRHGYALVYLNALKYLIIRNAAQRHMCHNLINVILKISSWEEKSDVKSDYAF